MPVAKVAEPAHNHPSKTLLTVKEASQLLHIHANTLRRWNDLGLIRASRLGPRHDSRFKREDIVAILDERRN